MKIIYILTTISLLLIDFIPGTKAGHSDLRRDLAGIKDIIVGIDGKLEKFNTLQMTNLEKKVQDLESILNTIMNKVEDMNRKSFLLSEIHQDNDAKKELLQRISRTVEEIGRKQSATTGRKHKSEIERLDKLSENVQALFQIFGGINRKLDDLQTRVERITNGCPLNDLKFFITKKVDSLTASTALLSECFECDRESIKDLFHSTIRHSIENVARKLHLCNTNDLERNIEKIMEAKWKFFIDSLQDDMNFKLRKFGSQLEDIKQDCKLPNGEVLPAFSNKNTNVDDIAYSHDTPQELRKLHKPSEDDSGLPRETPGRIFRKLWRKMTEPINKVGDKIEALGQMLEASHQRHYNQTITKLTEFGGKADDSDSCSRQVQTIVDTAKDTAQKLGYIESRQLTVQNLCSKILVEVERVKNSVGAEFGGVGVSQTSRTGVTESFESSAREGYKIATSCAELQEQGIVKNGIYTIKPKNATDEFLAYCDLVTDGGGWTVLQRRGDYGELRQNFTQGWEMYKRGFGDFQREFWIGNEKMHLLSTQEEIKLRIELEDFDGNTAFAEYSRFRVEDESHQYKLSVGDYHGNATDSLSLHDGKMFSTEDRDNDEVSSCCNCADTFKGGWWYYRCFEANLNGPYHTIPTENGYFLGIIWERWRGDYSLKSSEMKVRPFSFEDLRDP